MNKRRIVHLFVGTRHADHLKGREFRIEIGFEKYMIAADKLMTYLELGRKSEILSN